MNFKIDIELFYLFKLRIKRFTYLVAPKQWGSPFATQQTLIGISIHAQNSFCQEQSLDSLNLFVLLQQNIVTQLQQVIAICLVSYVLATKSTNPVDSIYLTPQMYLTPFLKSISFENLIRNNKFIAVSVIPAFARHAFSWVS